MNLSPVTAAANRSAAQIAAAAAITMADQLDTGSLTDLLRATLAELHRRGELGQAVVRLETQAPELAETLLTALLTE